MASRFDKLIGAKIVRVDFTGKAPLPMLPGEKVRCSRLVEASSLPGWGTTKKEMGVGDEQCLRF